MTMTQGQREVNRIAYGLADEYRAMTEYGEGAETCGDDCECADMWEFLNFHALEMYANARVGGYYSQTGPDLREVVIVFGTGGPHRELVVSWSGHVHGRAYWGGDTAKAWLGRSDWLFDGLAEVLGDLT